MIDKNPLAVFLGACLKHERSSNNQSSMETAFTLGRLSDSNYRLIESGYSLPQIHRAKDVCIAFPSLNIIFSRISLYLSGANLLYEMLKEGHTPFEAFEELVNFEPTFSLLFNIAKDNVYSKTYPKDFLIESVVPEVKRFLSNPNYNKDDSSSAVNNILVERLSHMRTITLREILEQSLRMEKHPPQHVGEFAKKWETENQDKFIDFTCLCTNVDLIVSDSNLSQFHYSYLSNPGFEKARFLFITEDSVSAESLKNTFIEKLTRYRKEKRQAFTTNEINSLEFKVISPSEIMPDVDIILSKRENIYDMTPEIYWQFTMKDHIPVGFIGGKVTISKSGESSDFTYAMNITLKQCNLSRSSFLKLWNSIL